MNKTVTTVIIAVVSLLLASCTKSMEMPGTVWSGTVTYKRINRGDDGYYEDYDTHRYRMVLSFTGSQYGDISTANIRLSDGTEEEDAKTRLAGDNKVLSKDAKTLLAKDDNVLTVDTKTRFAGKGDSKDYYDSIDTYDGYFTYTFNGGMHGTILVYHEGPNPNTLQFTYNRDDETLTVDLGATAEEIWHGYPSVIILERAL